MASRFALAVFVASLICVFSSPASGEPRARMKIPSEPRLDLEEVRIERASRLLRAVLDQMVGDGNLEGLIESFTESDRARFSGVAEIPIEDFHQSSNGFQHAWRRIYGHSFDAAAFENGDVISFDLEAAEGGVLLVEAPAKLGLPGVTLKMVPEAGSGALRLDVPDDLEARDLKSSIAATLRNLKSNRESWPRSEAEAYQIVAHRLLSILSQSQMENI